MNSILEQILGYQGDHPKDVAQAYYDVKQQIARDVGQVEGDQWQSLFDTAKLQGKSPADLHDPATGANVGSMASGPSELERWKMQIEGLIESGNPVLQKQGLSMLSQYQQRATAPESRTDNRTIGAKYADELGLQGKARRDFIESFAMKAGTTINMGDKYVPHTAKLFDKDGKPIKTPAGLTYDEAESRGYNFGSTPTAEESKQASAIQTSLANISDLRKVVKEQGADLSGLSGLISQWRSGNTAAGATVNSILNGLGLEVTDANVKALALTAGISNQVLQAYRGAQVGPKEQILFERQLPVPGQDMDLFMANLDRTERDLERLNKLVSEGRNFIGSPLYKELVARTPEYKGYTPTKEAIRRDKMNKSLPPGATILN